MERRYGKGLLTWNLDFTSLLAVELNTNLIVIIFEDRMVIFSRTEIARKS